MYSLLSDTEIREYVEKLGIINPFIDRTIRQPGCISYGLSCNVYDVRLEPRIQVFTNNNRQCDILDPVEGRCNSYTEFFTDEFVMPPHSFALGLTMEELQLPNDLFALVLGKSTYARYGVIVNPTCVMPGMKGKVVIELSNTCPMPVRIRLGPNNGICSLVFFRSLPCMPYDGHYQDQNEIIIPHSGI